MKFKIFLLVSIFLLTLFLRVYKLGEIPSGFYSDEVLYGYEAYSILKTGSDQYGTKFPIVFKAFGDYRPGLFIYTTVPFIGMMGLTEFATRFPSALFSTLTGIVIFFLGLELWKSFTAALLSSFLFAISPWSLQFARMSHETNLATFLTVLAIYLFIKGVKNGWFLVFSFLIFSISLYAYYSTRVFVPIYIALLFILFRDKLLEKMKFLGLGLILSIVLLLPFFKIITNQDTGWSRVEAVSLWGDKGLVAGINESYREDILGESPLSRVFHNKIVDGGLTLVKSFFSHFEPQFLLFNGDPIKVYQTPNTGILFMAEFILVVITVFILQKRINAYSTLLLIWLIVGLLPDTLTRLAPAAARIHLVLPLISLLAGFGFKQAKHKLLIVFLGILLIFQMTYFLHQNFVHVGIRYAQDWHYGLKEAILEIEKRENQYDQIWISRTGWGWINFLFYLKYPPEKIQKEIVLSERNEFGLGWVRQFDKYTFDYFPKDFNLLEKTLFVGTPADFSGYKMKKPLYTVYYPNKNVAFYLADSLSF